MVLLSQFTLESIFTHSGAIKLPHDKPVFLDKIRNSPVPVSNSMEPLVLVNVAFDNVHLSIQDIMKMCALVEHGYPKTCLFLMKS
jgi:hypothetical protein